jgi:hypothetical protein
MIYLGGKVTIPSHGWFMALILPTLFPLPMKKMLTDGFP